MRTTQRIALTAIFAALHAVLYLPEGPWRSFVIYLMPIEGIVLGPSIGFVSALIGSGIARLIKPSIWWMFGLIAEPIGVAAAGFLAKGRWKEVQLVYGVMLGAYFLHPYGRMLPLWTVLDLLAAFVIVYPASKMGKWVWKEQTKKFTVALLIIAFVSTVADSMTRVFLLVPCRYYEVLGLTYDVLAYEWFIPGAVGSYIEDCLVSITTLIAGAPLLLGLKKMLSLKQPLS
ncbi:MAG: hypothetical protein QXD34_02230 [Candidatus Bathyarchaeia archaeon]|nr:hypothetical protein [Candidatus Bathyarchaeota archaeon]